MGDHFSVHVGVRSYEVDANGHLNHAYYHRYGEHARTEHFSAAGCTMDRLATAGVGIVLLETHVRFLRELRHRDHVDVDSRLTFGEGKSFEIAHTLMRDDGVVVAEISCRMGLLDAAARRLVADPAGRLRELADDPAVLGL
ncbi:acyl-CoA thioesterase [Pseudonocardia nigra]|uniref:acyl-CoA thioesterase n=1 Tax=Pseudonocardia nigra TaxID=1921578 RepID=UPI001C606355|nr:acyl-CoA thioesterase [Pseudonocardia nigra]